MPHVALLLLLRRSVMVNGNHPKAIFLQSKLDVDHIAKTRAFYLEGVKLTSPKVFLIRSLRWSRSCIMTRHQFFQELSQDFRHLADLASQLQEVCCYDFRFKKDNIACLNSLQSLSNLSCQRFMSGIFCRHSNMVSIDTIYVKFFIRQNLRKFGKIGPSLSSP